MRRKWILTATLCGLWALPLLADQITINEQGGSSGTLPFKVTPGTLILCEGGVVKDPKGKAIGCQSGISDVLQFTQTNIGGVIRSQWTMFSEKEAKADTGAASSPGVEVDLTKIPPIKGNTSFIAETVSEDATETVAFTPAATEPGFALEGGPASYNITSDVPVPEPASLTLVALGLGALGLVSRCKRSRP
jgi:PEP-CTERM motif